MTNEQRALNAANGVIQRRPDPPQHKLWFVVLVLGIAIGYGLLAGWTMRGDADRCAKEAADSVHSGGHGGDG